MRSYSLEGASLARVDRNSLVLECWSLLESAILVRISKPFLLHRAHERPALRFEFTLVGRSSCRTLSIFVSSFWHVVERHLLHPPLLEDLRSRPSQLGFLTQIAAATTEGLRDSGRRLRLGLVPAQRKCPGKVGSADSLQQDRSAPRAEKQVEAERG